MSYDFQSVCPQGPLLIERVERQGQGMGSTSSVLCVGNFAIDYTESPRGRMRIPGGAGLRFVSAWALYGLPIRVTAIVGREPIWDGTLSLLEHNKVDTTNVMRRVKSLEFVTAYDHNQQITSFSIKRSDLMTELATVALSSNMQAASLVHICPFECRDQMDLVEKASSLGQTVSSMIHFSSLTAQTRTKYQELLPLLDFLFLNESEANFMLGCEHDWIGCGCLLSQAVRRFVFLTLGKRGAAVFAHGDLLTFSPPAGFVVRDILGAGDCFAGGALAGLMLSANPLTAVRCGSIAAAFALADAGHIALLRFLETNESEISSD